MDIHEAVNLKQYKDRHYHERLPSCVNWSNVSVFRSFKSQGRQRFQMHCFISVLTQNTSVFCGLNSDVCFAYRSSLETQLAVEFQRSVADFVFV